MKTRLHIGSGNVRIDGWINIDVQALPGVDEVIDVRNGLPFTNVDFIFAEHFIEHLQVEEAYHFLISCRSALSGDGVLRLSTPNLDWVMQSHYAFGRWLSEEDAINDCLMTNTAFYGWGHRFLYNYSMLSFMLRRSGFVQTAACEYGQSSNESLRGLERHPRSPDWPGLPDVIVVEAAGSVQSLPLTGQIDAFLEARDSC